MIEQKPGQPAPEVCDRVVDSQTHELLRVVGHLVVLFQLPVQGGPQLQRIEVVTALLEVHIDVPERSLGICPSLLECGSEHDSVGVALIGSGQLGRNQGLVHVAACPASDLFRHRGGFRACTRCLLGILRERGHGFTCLDNALDGGPGKREGGAEHVQNVVRLLRRLDGLLLRDDSGGRLRLYFALRVIEGRAQRRGDHSRRHRKRGDLVPAHELPCPLNKADGTRLDRAAIEITVKIVAKLGSGAVPTTRVTLDCFEANGLEVDRNLVVVCVERQRIGAENAVHYRLPRFSRVWRLECEPFVHRGPE